MFKKLLVISMLAILTACDGGGGGGEEQTQAPVTAVKKWTEVQAIDIQNNGTVLATSVMRRPDGTQLLSFNGPTMIGQHPWFTCEEVAFLAISVGAGGTIANATSTLAAADTAIHAREMVIADFNNDGIDDMFSANHGCDVHPAPGESNNLFLSSGNQIIDASSNVLNAGADFTHSTASAVTGASANVDIFVGAMPTEGSNVKPYMLRGDGLGNFIKEDASLHPNLKETYYSITAAHFADVNGDAHLDLIVGSMGAAFHVGWVYLNDGFGKFSVTQITLPVGLFGEHKTVVTDIASTDVNNDGHMDLLVSQTNKEYSLGRVQVLINNGEGYFHDQSSLITKNDNINWTQFMHFVDLNGDGIKDLLLQSAWTYDSSSNDTVAYIKTQTGYEPLIDDHFPTKQRSLIPVKVNGELILVSLENHYTGTKTIARTFVFK